MSYIAPIARAPQPVLSPLMLSDRLLTLAQDADQAGLRCAAEHLLSLACEVLDKPARTKRTRPH
jgi:hypothetical protein